MTCTANYGVALNMTFSKGYIVVTEKGSKV